MSAVKATHRIAAGEVVGVRGRGGTLFYTEVYLEGRNPSSVGRVCG